MTSYGFSLQDFYFGLPQFSPWCSYAFLCQITAPHSHPTHPTPPPVRHIMRRLFQTCTFAKYFDNGYLEHSQWNCPHVNTTGIHWLYVNIDLGNGLVSSSNKPLPEPVLMKFYIAILVASIVTYGLNIHITYFLSYPPECVVRILQNCLNRTGLISSRML